MVVRFGFLGGMFQVERSNLSFGGIFIFAKEPPGTSSEETLGSGVSNEAVPYVPRRTYLWSSEV